MSQPFVDGYRFRSALTASLGFVAFLWLIELARLAFGWDLLPFGVYPRDAAGSIGILSAPLVHGSWTHLLANTPALLVLGTLLWFGYPRSAFTATAGIWIGSGLGVWLFARESYHIGASGLTHGLLFFLFTIGVLRRDKRAIALSLVVFFLYGGMVFGLVPKEQHISFEYHGFGALLGLILAFVLRDRDPPPPRKVYSWELEDDEEDEFDRGLDESEPPGPRRMRTDNRAPWIYSSPLKQRRNAPIPARWSEKLS